MSWSSKHANQARQKPIVINVGNGVVFEAQTPDEKYKKIIVTADGAYAGETLTLAENVANTETVTVGAKTYTFQTTLTNVDGNVLIGASASDSLDNLIAAINHDPIAPAAGAGTLFAAATTRHPDSSASAGAGDTMDVEALAGGTAGNSLATTETLAGVGNQFGDTTMSGGTQGVATIARVDARDATALEQAPAARLITVTQTLTATDLDWPYWAVAADVGTVEVTFA